MATILTPEPQDPIRKIGADATADFAAPGAPDNPTKFASNENMHYAPSLDAAKADADDDLEEDDDDEDDADEEDEDDDLEDEEEEDDLDEDDEDEDDDEDDDEDEDEDNDDAVMARH
jgi:hypothetical protein